MVGRPGAHLREWRTAGRPAGGGTERGVWLDPHPAGRLCGVAGQPVTSAAAQGGERLPSPRRDRAHRREHVAGLVDGTVLELIIVSMRAAIRREPEVGISGLAGPRGLSRTIAATAPSC